MKSDISLGNFILETTKTKVNFFKMQKNEIQAIDSILQTGIEALDTENYEFWNIVNSFDF